MIVQQLRYALSDRLYVLRGEHREQNADWDPVERYLANENVFFFHLRFLPQWRRGGLMLVRSSPD